MSGVGGSSSSSSGGGGRVSGNRVVYETRSDIASRTFAAGGSAGEMKVRVGARKGDALEFDLSGVDASFANALRRIMLDEVASMAIEYVEIGSNSSIIQDEVLAHRLGLVPIAVDPELFVEARRGGVLNENNCVVFTMNVKCYKEGNEEYNGSVYSDSLLWSPLGNQQTIFENNPPRVAFPDILIAKLKPGQEIRLTAKCVKGIGKDHAKFQPVATASYRLLPVIELEPDYFVGEAAEKLKSRCPMKVFDIEDGAAIVARPRHCTMCRECIVPKKGDNNDFDWNRRIRLLRDGNYFQFSVESVGVLPPEVIVQRAIKVLEAKCQTLIDAITDLERAE